MKLHSSTQSPLHLTYCLNVHPAETWEQTLHVLQHAVLGIRSRFDKEQPFGLGLRLSADTARRLQDPSLIDGLREFLAEHNLYVFTINGFPYGPFHGQRVKEHVYEPNWTQAARRNYTEDLIRILAKLVPQDMAGSISTVPIGFGPSFSSEAMLEAAVENLAACVQRCREILQETGRLIHIGLEPEPSCVLETSSDVVRFFENWLLPSGCKFLAADGNTSMAEAEEQIRCHLGVCLDTCHAAVQFEDLIDCWERYEQAGILISKVQLSAALQSNNSAAARDALRQFDEGVYLHQVRALQPNTAHVNAWLDLPDALAELESYSEDCLVRTHCHVPLFWSGSDPLFSTAATMTDRFWEKLRGGSCPHIEVETYTFNVLPRVAAGDLTLAECVEQELRYACRATTNPRD